MFLSADETGRADVPEPMPGQSLVRPRTLVVAPDASRLAHLDGAEIIVQEATDSAVVARKRVELLQSEDAALAWSPNGRILAVSGQTATILLVEAATLDVVGRLVGHQAPPTRGFETGVSGLAFAPDSARLASAGPDGRVRLWSVPDGAEIGNIETGRTPYQVAFSPDGARLAIVNLGWPPAVHDASALERLAVLDDCPPQGRDVAWSPDGRWLAASSTDPARKVDVFDANTLTHHQTFAHAVIASGLAWHSTEPVLAIRDLRTGAVHGWDLGTDRRRPPGNSTPGLGSLIWVDDELVCLTNAGLWRSRAWVTPA